MEDPVEGPITSHISNQFVLVDTETDVATAVSKMTERSVDTIIVTLKGNPVGIVTDGDILERVVMKGEDSAKVRLGNIMSSPIITLPPDSTVKQALEAMGFNKIERILVVTKIKSPKDSGANYDNSGTSEQILGIVMRKKLADAIRTSVLERTFRKYRTSVRERHKAVLWNLGIVMQFAAMLLIVPAALATVFGETIPALGMYVSAVSMFATGFALNAFGEKASLSLKEASIVVITSYLMLSFLGGVPYMFINPFSPEISAFTLRQQFF